MSKPLVSVITGYYNRKDNILPSINSILNQSYENIEYIIFDDASTDGTSDILSSIKSERLLLVRHKINLGFTRGLIDAIRLSRGTYIALHGAGDYSYKDRVALQVEHMEENKHVGLVGCHSLSMNYGGREYYLNTKKTTFKHGEVLIRRSALEETGGYNSIYRFGQFTPMKAKISERYDIGCVERILYKQYLFLEGVERNASKKYAQLYYRKMHQQIKKADVGSRMFDEYRLPVINNAKINKAIYLSRLMSERSVETDELFDCSLKENNPYLHLLKNSSINAPRFFVVHVLLIAPIILRRIVTRMSR